MDHHPVCAEQGGFATFYWTAHPPLLGEEGKFRGLKNTLDRCMSRVTKLAGGVQMRTPRHKGAKTPRGAASNSS